MSKTTTSVGEPFAPSEERRQHDRITRAARQISDATGDIGRPYETEGLLGRLERRGTIGHSERNAGEEFQRMFQLAALDPLRAADMARVGGGYTAAQKGVEWARGRVNAALDALGGHGSPCGSCAWFVLGCDLSLRDWALREGWRGRPINEHVAKGTLLGTLGVLVTHFRT